MKRQESEQSSSEKGVLTQNELEEVFKLTSSYSVRSVRETERMDNADEINQDYLDYFGEEFALRDCVCANCAALMLMRPMSHSGKMATISMMMEASHVVVDCD
jgi:hypothetical protein